MPSTSGTIRRGLLRRSWQGICTAMPLLLLIGCGENSDILTPPPLVADPILIDARWNPSTPSAEQTADIDVTVQNQGGLDAKAFDVRLQVVQNPCTPAAIVRGNYVEHVGNGLLSGAAVLLHFHHDFQNIAGQYGVYLFLDEDEAIDEHLPDYDGETNNVYTCGSIVDHDGHETLGAGETFINVLAPGGGGGGGVIGVLPKAAN